MDYFIRRLKESDEEEWRRLWGEYLSFYRAELPEEQTDITWQRLVDPRHDPFGLAAESNGGAVIGIAHYLFHSSTWTPGPYCYLQDLFVERRARQSGVGGSLMEAVFDAGRKAGASKIYWLTQEHNRRARLLYDRVGHATEFIKYESPAGIARPF